MDARKQFKKWLGEICRGSGSEHNFIHHVDGSGPLFAERVKIYTRDHYYTISAREKGKRRSYLGCTVSTRKPRAGESHTRGNDLPDGRFSQETWNKIKNAIIAYELVKVAKPVRHIPDDGPNTVGPSLAA